MATPSVPSTSAPPVPPVVGISENLESSLKNLLAYLQYFKVKQDYPTVKQVHKWWKENKEFVVTNLDAYLNDLEDKSYDKFLNEDLEIESKRDFREGDFRYDNSLGRLYDVEEKKIRTITFPKSRFQDFEQKITFDTPQTEYDAIRAVERYLSEPITREYFDEIKSDLFDSNLLFEELASKGYNKRGDLLTDLTFLERITVDPYGNADLTFGS